MSIIKRFLFAAMAALFFGGKSNKELPIVLKGQEYDPIMHGGFSAPVFFPRKHTVMSYAKQNRIAKSKRKSKSYATR